MFFIYLSVFSVFIIIGIGCAIYDKVTGRKAEAGAIEKLSKANTGD